MSLMQFLRILWARRLFVVACVFAAALVGAVTIKVLPTKYKSESRVLLDLIKPDPVTGEIISSGNMRAYVQTQAELITDYRVTGRVVDQLDWQNSPVYQTAYEQRPSSDKRDFRRWAAQTVADNTKVSLLDNSNILEIQYTSTSAESARRIADAIRQAYVDVTLSFKRDAATRSEAWFTQQAAQLRTRLIAAEDALNKFEKANDVVLTADAKDADETRLAALAATVSPGPTISAPITPALSPSQSQLAQIDARIAVASKTLGPNNPQMQALERERAAVASAAARELAAARAASRPAAQGPSLESQLSAQQSRVLAKRAKINEAQKMAEDVALLRDQYTKTASRAAEFGQQAVTTESGLTLLGSAVAPSNASFPNIPLIMVGALMGGAALGLFGAVGMEIFRRRVRGIEDMARLDVPMIGMMAREIPQPAQRLLPAPLRLGWMQGGAS